MHFLYPKSRGVAIYIYICIYIYIYMWSMSLGYPQIVPNPEAFSDQELMALVRAQHNFDRDGPFILISSLDTTDPRHNPAEREHCGLYPAILKSVSALQVKKNYGMTMAKTAAKMIGEEKPSCSAVRCSPSSSGAGQASTGWRLGLPLTSPD